VEKKIRRQNSDKKDIHFQREGIKKNKVIGPECGPGGHADVV